jgi:NAD(P)-dependent dehydrogenase (short-subunit alcohol dehydrogenase family)
VCPGTIVTASFTENLKDILATDGLDATDPYDVMTWIDNNFHQPCDLGRAGLPEEVASITTYLASRRKRLCHRCRGQRRRGLGLHMRISDVDAATRVID